MSEYTAAGEWVTPERVDEIRAEGRRQVLDVVRAALPSADANYIESRVREVTTPFASTGATPVVNGARPWHDGRLRGGNPVDATETAAALNEGPTGSATG